MDQGFLPPNHSNHGAHKAWKKQGAPTTYNAWHRAAHLWIKLPPRILAVQIAPKKSNLTTQLWELFPVALIVGCPIKYCQLFIILALFTRFFYRLIISKFFWGRFLIFGAGHLLNLMVLMPCYGQANLAGLIWHTLLHSWLVSWNLQNLSDSL